VSARIRKGRAEALVERLRLLRRRGEREARPVALAGVYYTLGVNRAGVPPASGLALNSDSLSVPRTT
jgi:hypothetical protein